MRKEHEYLTHLAWEGNTGEGTATYAGYGREYRIVISGKPDIMGSADPQFRGDGTRHNPEDMFIAALSSCHMLSYLALCARESISVLTYEDDAKGILVFDGAGGGKFSEVTLRPSVTIAGEENIARAHELHDTAHQQCYVASSCSVSVTHIPTVRAE